MKKAKVLMLIAMVLFLATSLAMAQGVVSLPQTGQTRCWDTAGNEIPCAGTGQDGEIRAGVEWPEPRFTPGTGDEAGCMIDNLTGLMWPKNANLPGGTRTWNDAIDYANNLTLCGHSDWRLPNVNELESLINADALNIAAWLTSQGFSNVQSDHYWSSTTHARSSDDAWIVHMWVGNVVAAGANNKDNDYYVWAVRAITSGTAQVWKTGQTTSYRSGDDGDLELGVSWPNPRFTAHSNGTATDNLTGLMWTEDANAPGPSSCGSGTSKTWQGALDYVKCLNTQNYLDHSDWRLPNRKELLSLIDRSQYNRALPAGHPFQGVQSNVYWSSTTSAYNKDCTWSIYMWDGSAGIFERANYYVWPVRGGLIAPVITPTIAMSPMSGPPGTTFTEWGTGFTPNGTATLHFRKPDGIEDPTTTLTLDATGHFEITYTAPAGKLAGNHTWWAIDNASGKKSNEVTYTIVAPVITPTIAMSPMSGPPGTTFTEWGTGFTPNGTATLHFRKPDGIEDPTTTLTLDATGHFEITYTAPAGKLAGNHTWWAIDNASGKKSNEVTYTIVAPVITPTIAMSPMSGPPGTTFTEWGTGFTPNGTATLHFRKPDGIEDPTTTLTLDATGHFEITYTAPAGKLAGNHTWWAIDNASGKKSNEVTYTIVAPVITPTIAMSPMSGPPGTTFTEWGTGFTPNGTATLHFRKPDGIEDPTTTLTLDATGHFEITYTAPAGKLAGNHTWWAIDNASGKKSNEVTYTIVAPVITPTIAMSPMSGPPGTTFTEWGTGFTPNGTATLHFRKPDGIEDPTTTLTLDATGHFEITYTAPAGKLAGNHTWWAIDNASGKKSNEVTYTIEAVSQTIWGTAFNLANISTQSDQFQIWADLTENGQTKDDICQRYTFSIAVGGDIRAGSVGPECDFLGGSKYRLWFAINNHGMPNDRARYFENGELLACTKDVSPTCTKVDGLNDFSVWGTTFDIQQHAWKFKNGSWTNITDRPTLNDIHQAASIIADHLKETVRSDFLENHFTGTDSAGGCYGLANSAIANFNHKGKAWGIGGIDAWDEEIHTHWPEPPAPDHVVEPYKPYDTDAVYGLGWSLQSAKKIMYYFVTQPSYREQKQAGNNWIGADLNTTITSSEKVAAILAGGSPISLRLIWGGFFSGGTSRHRVAVSQLISWNGHDKYMIWDNNWPSGLIPNEYGPYLEWYIDNNKQYDISFSERGGKFINHINTSDGTGLTKRRYSLSERPMYLSYDSQNIYAQEGVPARNNAFQEERLYQESPPRVNYTVSTHMQIIISGAMVEGVYDTATGLAIPLIPNGEIISGQSVITSSGGGVYNFIYLPADKTYRIEATKYSDFEFLEVYATIPNADGTIQKLNYENVQTGPADKTHISFTVGRNNANKGIIRTVVPSSSPKGQVMATTYNPDYDGVVATTIPAPGNFRGSYQAGGITLNWDNPSSPSFSQVQIVRNSTSFPASPTDGTIVYQGRGTQTIDTGAVPGQSYYYGAFSIDTSANISNPAYTGINTTLYSISGTVENIDGQPLSGVEVSVTDDQQRVVNTTMTGSSGAYVLSNLPNGNYTVGGTRIGLQVNNYPVTINGSNIQRKLTAYPLQTLLLLFNLDTVITGTEVVIPWGYRNIRDDRHVDIVLLRQGVTEPIAHNVPITQGNVKWVVTNPPEAGATLKLSLSENSTVFAEKIIDVEAPPSYHLTVTRLGTGTGLISGTGLVCTGATCSGTYLPGTSVTLAATASPGSVFTGWSGGGCSGTGTCTVVMNANTNVTATFTIQPCTYTLSPSSKTFPAKGFGLSTNVTVTGTGLPTCPVPSIVEGYDWITATMGTWSRNKATVKIAVTPSTQSSVRTGTVTIGGSPFTLTQSGAPCAVTSLSPSSATLPGTGGTRTFAVTTSTTDCPWTASPSQTWIHITAGGSGTGSGSVTFTADPYSGSMTRSGSIVVQPPSGGSFSSKKTFAVKQTK